MPIPSMTRAPQGIMVVVFIKTNIQSKVMNEITMIPCERLSERELVIKRIETLGDMCTYEG